MSTQPREALYRGRPDLNPLVYDTSIPLIVTERIDGVTTYDDGTRAEKPPLLALWRAVDWLAITFPGCDGFNQRQIAEVAWVDQKTVHKRLRLLHQLGLIVEVGQRHYDQLTGRGRHGGAGEAKIQRLYTTPRRELLEISAREAPAIVERWRRRLFGGSTHTTSTQWSPDQLALDLGAPSDPLEDQETPRSDPLGDQETPRSDPLGDQALIPYGIRSDPLGDQTSDPLEDQRTPMHEGARMRTRAVSQSVSQSEGERSALSELGQPNQPDCPTPDPPVPPPPPAGERPLAEHPLVYLHRQREHVTDPDLFAMLAAEHDAPTAGHGWYWLGRAIEAGVVAKGGIEQVKNLFSLTRAVLGSWRDRGAYGAPPATHPRPRPAPRARAVGDAPPAQARDRPRLSSLPIITAGWVAPDDRARWEGRFRAADGPDAQQRILEDFHRTHPPPPSAD